MPLDGLPFDVDGLIAESSRICAVYGREFPSAGVTCMVLPRNSLESLIADC